MLPQKATPFWIGSILVLAVMIPMLIAGYSSLRQAEEAEAQMEYQRAAESYAHAARFLFWRSDLPEKAAIASARAGEYSAAIGYFGKGENLSEQGWLWLCTSHIQLDDLPSAISACNDGIKKYESADLYGLLAFIHRSQNDWAAEQDALENQTRLNPADAYAAYRLGLLLTLSAPEGALPELTRASTLNPEVDSAVQTLRAALAVSSQQRDPSMQKVVIGQAFGLVQDWQLAQTAFEQAVQINEKNAEAWAWLGEAKQQTGQGGSAELDRALSLDPYSVNVRALRGLYWSRQGRYEQMLAEYLLASEIEPENPRWRASIGEAYTKLGDLVAALAAYQRAVELSPAQAEYWRLLALFCVENNVQTEEIGLPAAQYALALAPNDPAVLDTQGYVYLSTGRYANAELSFMKAIGIAPEYFPAHVHLAMNYLAQGNRAAAFNSLTYVRDADETGVYAELARQLLDKYFR
ncbi:MAG: hypothetical protein Fur0017_11430 [Anaerolineales bacterium]